MPKSVDVLLGLSVIMLIVSMTVTMLTQATTSLLNSDGNRLRDGLVNLLLQINPAITLLVYSHFLKHAESDVADRLAHHFFKLPVPTRTRK